MGKTERTDQETFLKNSIPEKLFSKFVNGWY